MSEEEKKEKGAEDWKTEGSQPLEDRALKEAARLFGEELMPLLGIKGKIRRIAPTEQVYLKPADYMQDFNYEMMDGGWIHLEFESDSIRTADLRRFRVYEAVMSQYYEAEVTTYVICSSGVKKLKDHLTEGMNTYHVGIIRLKDRNADEIFQRLERKQQENGLERADLLEVLLSPLMDGEMPQKERIQRGFSLLRGEWGNQTQEELARMEAVLYTFAMKFLAITDLIEIKEMMKMTILGEMILQDGIQRGIKQGLEQGLERGIEQGLEQGIEQVNRLNEVLIETGRMDDLKRSAVDAEYQKKLMRELFSGTAVRQSS